MILDSDLSNGWYITTKRIPLLELCLIMFTIKMVLIKFNFFYFVVNKSLWEPLLRNHDFISFLRLTKCVSKEHIRRNLNVWLYIIDFLVCSGCEEV